VEPEDGDPRRDFDKEAGPPQRQDYCAVIGDIVGSRVLSDRGGLQRKFAAAVTDLNEWLKGPDLVSRLVITAGDEFQGLLARPARAYDLLVRAEGALPGVRLRLGVGLGVVDTAINDMAIGMDGPAFHRAREALTRCKAENLSWAVVSGCQDWDRFVTSYVCLAEWLRRSWTPRQREMIDALEYLGTQALAAESLGVSEAAVSQALKAAGWQPYRLAREHLRAYLAGLAGDLRCAASMREAGSGDLDLPEQ